MPGLHTELVGSGRPVFAFLHGLFGRGRNWTQVAQQLAAAGYASVLFDLPDHGRSPWTDHFSYPNVAAAVAAEIEQRLGSAAELVLVGHSMGGKVAMLLALEHPDVAAGLAVVDIAPGTSEQVDTFTPLVAAMRGLDVESLETRAEADARLRAQVPDDAVRAFLLQNLRRKGGWHWQQNLDLLGDSLPLVGGWPRVDADPYHGPVLWLLGERSSYVRPHHSDAMLRLFPNTERVVVPGAGHWVQADNPDAVVSGLLALAERAGFRPA